MKICIVYVVRVYTIHCICDSRDTGTYISLLIPSQAVEMGPKLDRQEAGKARSKRNADTDDQTTNPTIADLYKLMKRNQDTLEDNTIQLNTIASRMKRMENRLDDVEDRVDVLEQKSNESAVVVKSTVRDLREDLSEAKQRLLKRDNAIIFGIPEDEEGHKLYDELMKILLPSDMSKITYERLGDVTKITEKGPRPILVCTGNSLLKRRMFRNLKQLKDIEQFKKINVKHDLTKLQRKELTNDRQLRSQQTSTSNGNRQGRIRARSEGEEEDPNKRIRRDVAEGGLTPENMEGVE